MPTSARTPITTPTAIPAIAPLLRPEDELAVVEGVAICVAADVIVADDVADVDIDADVVEVAPAYDTNGGDTAFVVSSLSLPALFCPHPAPTPNRDSLRNLIFSI